MIRLLKAAFWGAALIALVAALLPVPPQLPAGFTDKLQHMAAFFTLAVLGSLAYPGLSALRLLAYLGLFGALIEVAQAFPGLNRETDLMDFLADLVAAAAGVLMVAGIRRLLARR
jgi:VanZ family protein